MAAVPDLRVVYYTWLQGCVQGPRFFTMPRPHSTVAAMVKSLQMLPVPSLLPLNPSLHIPFESQLGAGGPGALYRFFLASWRGAKLHAADVNFGAF